MARKRTKGSSKEKGCKKVPSSIMVQRMSSQPTGRQKKYEPLDTRDFVDFSDYDEITIENVREACERFYDAPRGSCDILLSDRGPSCFLDEQIEGKKVFFVRFVTPASSFTIGRERCAEKCTATYDVDRNSSQHSETGTLLGNDCSSQNSNPKAGLPVPSSCFPKSVSVADLLKARKLVKPDERVEVMVLESFDVGKQKWSRSEPIKFNVKDSKFAEGGFRDAFMAVTDNPCYTRKWVVKKYKMDVIEDMLQISAENHTRKQVQMHSVAKQLALKLAKKAPVEYGNVFKYETIYFSKVADEPVTIEVYIDGTFRKYVNNDGKCGDCSEAGMAEVYAKAESLCHFSYVESNKELMLLDLQGVDYRLYDPEIATASLIDDIDNETYFCAGNLSINAIENFLSVHQCNKYCFMLGIDNLERIDQSSS